MTKARASGHVFSCCKISTISEGALLWLKHMQKVQRLAVPTVFILTAASWGNQGVAEAENPTCPTS